MRTEKEEASGNIPRVPGKPVDREAVFRTVRGALMFAMNFTHGTLKRPTLVEMMGGGTVGRGLGGLDGAAQAGMIRAELERVSPQRRSIIIARCASPTLSCSCKACCCRGWKENPEWGEAINHLTGCVLEQGLAGTVSHYRLRRAMVVRYFLGKAAVGPKQSLVEISRVCGVHRNTASVHNKAVVEHLKREEQLATYEIEGLLKEGGVIE